MQNPRQRNMASCPQSTFPPHCSSTLVVCVRKWVWAARSSWLAPWLLSRTLKSRNRLWETSSSGTSLSFERSFTSRRVLSFLDRFSTTQGTNRCLYDFHFFWNRARAVLNIKIGASETSHWRMSAGSWLLQSLPTSRFKIRKTVVDISILAWKCSNFAKVLQYSFFCIRLLLEMWTMQHSGTWHYSRGTQFWTCILKGRASTGTTFYVTRKNFICISQLDGRKGVRRRQTW